MQADKTFFPRREFCFTLDGDIFVRYQSFKSGAELEQALKQRCPSKIDIGPVYNVDPKKRAAYTNGAFKAVERELIFDIDMDDYNDGACSLLLSLSLPPLLSLFLIFDE